MLPFQTEHGKRKPGNFVNPFTVAQGANSSLSFVRLFTETNRSYPFANGPNGLNRLNGLNRFAYLYL